MSAIVNIRNVIRRGGKDYRVIALLEDLVVLFPIEGTAFKVDCVPFHVLGAELRDGTSTRIDDPAIQYLNVSHTPKEIEAAQQRFSLIEPIVHNTEAIVNSKLRLVILKNLAEERGETLEKIRRYAYRYLSQYFRFGMSVSSLARQRTPESVTNRAYKVKGGRKSRLPQGTIVTNEIRALMTDVLKRYVLKDGGLSIPQAYSVFATDFAKTFPSIPKEQVPTITQFRYHFNTRISAVDKVTLTNSSIILNKDIAPATGTVLEIAKFPGAIYEIDSTVDNIYLLSSDKTMPVGRPVLYSVVDAYSGMIVGIDVSFEGSQYRSAAQAIFNAIRNKQEYCNSFNVLIGEDEWPAEGIPTAIVADNGELAGAKIEHFAKTFGVQISNTAPHRGDQKGSVEQSFRLLQHELASFVQHAAPDPVTLKKAGGKDNRSNATLTLYEYTRLVIEAVLLVNKRIRTVVPSDYPVTSPATPNAIWLWARNRGRWGISAVDSAMRLCFALMPTVKPTFSDHGINVEGLRYECQNDAVKELFLRGRNNRSRPPRALVAYDPSNVSIAYLIPDSNKPMTFYPCELTANYKRYAGMSIYEASRVLETKRDTDTKTRRENAFAEGETRQGQALIVEQAKATKPQTTMTNSEMTRRIAQSRSQERLEQNRALSFATTEPTKKLPQQDVPSEEQSSDGEWKALASFDDIADDWK